MSERKTLSGYAEYRLEEKKSVFIAEAKPVENEEDARQFIDAIKKKYHDASHHVYAYSLSQGFTQRYSDDGEPQGTGGLPILNVIKNSGANDFCVVVTRYFGGTLLGTGGLTRAYGGAAKGAVEKAGTVSIRTYCVYRLELSYSDYQKYVTPITKFGAKEEKTEFKDKVAVFFSIPESDSDAFLELVRNLSSGQYTATLSETIEKA